MVGDARIAVGILSLFVVLAWVTQAQGCNTQCRLINGTISCNSSVCGPCVNLSNSGIRDDDLKDHTFTDCTQLETLVLSGNLLEKISDRLFLGLKQMIVLDLSRNRISHVEDYAFKDCENLESLDLSNNRIASFIDKAFHGLVTLKNLHLFRNNLTYLESSLFYQWAVNIEVLDLRNNSINRIDHNAFNDLTELFSLQLGYNQLDSLHDLHFRNLVKLKFLHLDNNGISDISDTTFKDLQNLEILDLENNRISELKPHTFDGLHSLLKLDLSGNDLTKVAPTIRDLGSLLMILLNRNPIVEILPNSFPESTEEIFLEQMTELSAVKNASFTGLPILSKVYIQGCPKLDAIESHAFRGDDADSDADSLRVLALNHNNLKVLDSRLVNWGKLDTLHLAGSSWTCDCHMQWVKDEDAFEEPSKTMICNLPKSLHGQSIASVDHLSCSTSHSWFGLALLIVTIVAFALVAVVAGWMCYMHKYMICPCFFESPGRYKKMSNEKGSMKVSTPYMHHHI